MRCPGPKGVCGTVHDEPIARSDSPSPSLLLLPLFSSFFCLLARTSKATFEQIVMVIVMVIAMVIVIVIVIVMVIAMVIVIVIGW